MKLGEAWEWIKGSPIRTIVFVLCAALLIVAIIPTVITWAPHWLASTSGLKTGDQRASEVDATRTALLAVLAGSIAVVGAVYTARTFALNRRTYEHARETTRQGHELDQARLTTERFTRAVDQLGNKDSLDVRLGGIYALERLARESQEDRGSIIEILTAYVREHAGRPMRAANRPVDPHEHRAGWARSLGERPNEAPVVLNRPTTDVQAVLTVLRRLRLESHDPDLELDLHETALSGADLDGARLQGANLGGANLQGATLGAADLQGAFLGWANLQRAHLPLANLRDADLGGANLQEANLGGADLQDTDLNEANLQRAKLHEANLKGASLVAAHLEEAYFSGANLKGAILHEANLQRATIREANLEGANLSGASLEGAWLHGANLLGANLNGSKFEGACYDGRTCWPDDFEPEGRGAVLHT
jgi:hypothetical protein